VIACRSRGYKGKITFVSNNKLARNDAINHTNTMQDIGAAQKKGGEGR